MGVSSTSFKPGHKLNIGKHWKMSEETKAKLIGRNKGRKHTQETKDKISKILKGMKRSEEYKKRMSESKKGIGLGIKKPKVTDEARKNMSIARSSSGSSFWRGGKTTLVLSIRNCFKYRQWRSDVYTRDSFTCLCCGVKGGKLEAHHIERLADLLDKYNIKTFENALNCEELWNINNGQTLCVSCHKKTDNYGRRPKNN